VAGGIGRDRVAVEEQIAELEALAVPQPSIAPVFYRVSASRLTTAGEIESTTASSGEVEASLLRHGGGRYGGVGSDHTDREVQTYGVAVAEQMCDKPIASEFWRYEEATPHWDRSIVRSWIDEETLYQEGPLGARMHPDALLELAEPALTDGTVMFCRTSAAIGGIRPAYRFRYQRPRPRTPARRPLRDAAAGARFLTLRCGEA
jgi:hypothetical protein